MALKATIFKVELRIADMDRAYYHDHALTIARHPSETDERMMARVLAFALNAHEALTFANGMGVDDEPDLWQKDLTGSIERWIDVGQPDEKRIRKACGRAREVCIYSYSGHSAAVWWGQIGGKIERVKNLTVINLPPAAIQSMAKLAQRSMQFQCTIQDRQIWIADKDDAIHIDLNTATFPVH